MAKIVLIGCERCGSTYDPDDGQFFANRLGETLHACPDGIFGAVAELDGPIAPLAIQAATPCPVCGGPMLPAEAPRPDGPERPVAHLRCPKCLVAEALVGGERHRWLEEIEAYLPPRSDPKAEPRPGGRVPLHPVDDMGFHFRRVQSLSGLSLKPSEISRALGLNANSMAHVEKRGRGRLVIECGCCGQNMRLFRPARPFRVRARGVVDIEGMDCDFIMQCPASKCGRLDYFLRNEPREKWTWFYTTIPSRLPEPPHPGASRENAAATKPPTETTNPAAADSGLLEEMRELLERKG